MTLPNVAAFGRVYGAVAPVHRWERCVSNGYQKITSFARRETLARGTPPLARVGIDFKTCGLAQKAHESATQDNRKIPRFVDRQSQGYRGSERSRARIQGLCEKRTQGHRSTTKRRDDKIREKIRP